MFGSQVQDYLNRHAQDMNTVVTETVNRSLTTCCLWTCGQKFQPNHTLIRMSFAVEIAGFPRLAHDFNGASLPGGVLSKCF